jgi:diaminohydroxyphosphoribosylaminopyrimidine deaminase/5-amino-6-(5-phosphoribosylamino)uracil reductase
MIRCSPAGCLAWRRADRCGSSWIRACVWTASPVWRKAREHPLWIVATETADRGRRQRLEDAGARVIAVPAAGDGRCDPEATAAALGGSGLTRVLIEGGGAIAAAFLKPGLIDRLIWMRAPGLLGGDARPAVAALGLVRPADALRFTRVETRFAGGDAIEIYDRAEAPCSPAS